MEGAEVDSGQEIDCGASGAVSDAATQQNGTTAEYTVSSMPQSHCGDSSIAIGDAAAGSNVSFAAPGLCYTTAGGMPGVAPYDMATYPVVGGATSAAAAGAFQSYMQSCPVDPAASGVQYPYGMYYNPAMYYTMQQQQRIALTTEFTEEPVYVNAKQYAAILRRREQRAKAEAENKLIKTRKPYLHESRHAHATRRLRGPGGRFLSAAEKAALREAMQHNDQQSNSQSTSQAISQGPSQGISQGAAPGTTAQPSSSTATMPQQQEQQQRSAPDVTQAGCSSPRTGRGIGSTVGDQAALSGGALGGQEWVPSAGTLQQGPAGATGQLDNDATAGEATGHHMHVGYQQYPHFGYMQPGTGPYMQPTACAAYSWPEAGMAQQQQPAEQGMLPQWAFVGGGFVGTGYPTHWAQQHVAGVPPNSAAQQSGECGVEAVQIAAHGRSAAGTPLPPSSQQYVPQHGNCLLGVAGNEGVSTQQQEQGVVGYSARAAALTGTACGGTVGLEDRELGPDLVAGTKTSFENVGSRVCSCPDADTNGRPCEQGLLGQCALDRLACKDAAPVFDGSSHDTSIHGVQHL